MSKTLVVLSGGQDSSTCLYWAVDKFGTENVSCVSFDYGQRHIIELKSAQKIAEMASVKLTILPINTFSSLGGNALIDKIDVQKTVNEETQLPNTFVPGRNIIFLTYAAALAYGEGITNLVTGVAQTDYSGYPDCRLDTLQALEKTLCLGMAYNIKIHSPLMNLSKAQTVKLAEKLGAMQAMSYTHSCYNGVCPPCGDCPACILRAKGFKEAGIADPLLTRLAKKNE